MAVQPVAVGLLVLGAAGGRVDVGIDPLTDIRNSSFSASRRRVNPFRILPPARFHFGISAAAPA